MKDTVKPSISLRPDEVPARPLDLLDLDRVGQCPDGESLTAFFKFLGIRTELPGNLTQKVLTHDLPLDDKETLFEISFPCSLNDVLK